MTVFSEPTRDLSPAQKAWLTRRARQAARDDQETRKAIAKETPPANIDSPVVELYLDDPTVGCGFRRLIVASIGPQWVTLFSASTLGTVRLDRLTFNREAKPVREFNARTLTRIIRRNVKSADKHSFRYSARVAEAAIEALEATR